MFLSTASLFYDNDFLTCRIPLFLRVLIILAITAAIKAILRLASIVRKVSFVFFQVLLILATT